NIQTPQLGIRFRTNKEPVRVLTAPVRSILVRDSNALVILRDFTAISCAADLHAAKTARCVHCQYLVRYCVSGRLHGTASPGTIVEMLVSPEGVYAFS